MKDCRYCPWDTFASDACPPWHCRIGEKVPHRGPRLPHEGVKVPASDNVPRGEEKR